MAVTTVNGSLGTTTLDPGQSGIMNSTSGIPSLGNTGNGTWNSTTDITPTTAASNTVSPVLCSDPPHVLNAALENPVVNGSTAAGHVATYTCHQDYSLSSGDAQLTCLTNGTWSGAPPVCSLIATELSYTVLIIIVVLACLFFAFVAFWLIQDFARYHHRKNSNAAKKIRKQITKSAFRPGLFYIKIPPEKLKAQIYAIPPPSLDHLARENEVNDKRKYNSRSLRSLKKKSKKHRKTLSMGPEMEFQGYYHNEAFSEHVGGIEDLAPVAGSPKVTAADVHGSETSPDPASVTAELHSAPSRRVESVDIEDGPADEEPQTRKKKKKSLLRRRDGDNSGSLMRSDAVDMPENGAEPDSPQDIPPDIPPV